MTNQMDLRKGPAGARDLILECQEMLAGQRTRFTTPHEYYARRLRYWQGKANARSRSSRWAMRRAA
jgi:hypothetical protein